MGLYTLELNEILKDGEIFDFEYDFYTDNYNIRSKFEQKFINKYYFHEIGFNDTFRFKWYLKAKLDEVAPYYQQLYESELKAKNIDFLLNKDYTETYIKSIDKSNTLKEIADMLSIDNLKSTNKDTTSSVGEANTTTNRKEDGVNKKDTTTNTSTYSTNRVNNEHISESNNTNNTISGSNQSDNRYTENNNNYKDNSTQSESKAEDGVANVNSLNYLTGKSITNNDGTKKDTTLDNGNSVASSNTMESNNSNTRDVTTNLDTNNTTNNLKGEDKLIIDTRITDTNKQSNKESKVNEGVLNSDKTTTNNTNREVEDNAKEREEFTLIGKGNIGITSSSELLEKWRACMINIDRLLLEELSDLFMLIY